VLIGEQMVFAPFALLRGIRHALRSRAVLRLGAAGDRASDDSGDRRGYDGFGQRRYLDRDK
jgi:hypothetical protein